MTDYTTPVDHNDYMLPAQRCELVTNLQAGDRVWLRSPDGFDPWSCAYLVLSASPCDGGGAWLDVRSIGGNGALLSDHKWGDRRYFSPSDRAYRCRNAEVAA